MKHHLAQNPDSSPTIDLYAEDKIRRLREKYAYEFSDDDLDTKNDFEADTEKKLETDNWVIPTIGGK